jgi:hypothetical protein
MKMKPWTVTMKDKVKTVVINPGGGQRIAHFEDHFIGMYMNRCTTFKALKKLSHHLAERQKIYAQDECTI